MRLATCYDNRSIEPETQNGSGAGVENRQELKEGNVKVAYITQ